MLLIVLALMIIFGLIRFAIRFSWGVLKFLCGLALFVLCPGLFIWLVVSGWLGIGLIPALLIAVFFGFAFQRA